MAGAMSGITTDLSGATDRVLPVLAFLIALTVFAELCAAAGLFDAAAHRSAVLGRGQVLRLWLLIVGLATVCTVLLSLDTTAVLLTPVAITVARQVGISPLPFAMATLWLANTASLLLPVSNLTNLLALHHFSPSGGGLPAYLRLVALPAVVAVVATVALLWVAHRKALRGRYEVAPLPEPHDAVLLRTAAVTCALLVGLILAGSQPWMAATAVAVVLGATCYWRRPELLRHLHLPWLTVLGIAALFVLVEVARGLGLDAAMQTVAGDGEGVTDLLQVSAVGALSANTINNLPAYLALEPTVSGSSVRLVALLVGVNVGPLVLPWASVATLLWYQRCRVAGLPVSRRRVARWGALAAVVVVSLTTLTLALAGPR